MAVWEYLFQNKEDINMLKFNAMDHFKNLLINYTNNKQLALDFESPNSEDDIFIKMAVIGFSYNSPTGDWGRGHFDFIRKRLDGDLATEETEEVLAAQEHEIKLFSCLCLGFLLGLYQAEKITDQKFMLGDAHLPAVIALYRGTKDSPF